MRENDLNPHDIVQAHYRSLKLKNAADAGSQCRIWSKNRLETPKVRSHRIAPHQPLPSPCEKMYKNLTGEEKKTNPCRKQPKSARIGRKKLFRAGKTAKTSAGGSEKASVGADVCEGGDRDPGRERESLSEHGTAGVQGRPGGERVVNQEDVGCRA